MIYARILRGWFSVNEIGGWHSVGFRRFEYNSFLRWPRDDQDDASEKLGFPRWNSAGVLEGHSFVFFQEIWTGVGRLNQFLADHVGFPSFPSGVKSKSRDGKTSFAFLMFSCSAWKKTSVSLCLWSDSSDSRSCLLDSNILPFGVASAV